MSDGKHTPETWTVEKSETHGICWIEDEHEIIVCDLYTKGSSQTFAPFSNALQNAHLISAAPDLKEALEQSFDYLVGLKGFDFMGPDMTALQTKIKAALAKSNGEK